MATQFIEQMLQDITNLTIEQRSDIPSILQDYSKRELELLSSQLNLLKAFVSASLINK